MAIAGMKADSDYLVKTLRITAKEYMHKTGQQIGINQFGRAVSVELYRKRFFPWYTFNIVAGLDETGNGMIYSYDAVGSSGTYQYQASGSGESLAISTLDSEIMPLITENRLQELTIEKAKQLAEKTITAVAEREIKTGDTFLYHIITAYGIEQYRFELRRD